MAAELYVAEPVFRAAFDRCAELLAPALGCDLRRLVHPDAAEVEAQRALDQTALTQPALFAVEYAVAQLWLDWGVRPQAMLGHSVGELVAACLAGVFTLDDALELVALRGRLVGELPGGAMLGVRLGEAEILPLLGEGVELAAVNGPSQVSVAGPLRAIEAFAERLQARGVAHRRLRTSHAFHSEAVAPVLDRFAGEVARRRPAAPRLPWISNVTGDWIQAAEATDPSYWARHLRRPVRFADGVAKLVAEPGRAFLEVGPGRALTSLIRRQPGAESAAAVEPSLPQTATEADDHEFLLGTLGRLWVAGVEIDWERFHRPARRRRVGLPTYPFERRRYWVEAVTASRADGAAAAAAAEPEVPALYAWSRRGAPYAAPATDLERRVSELWQEFLGIAQIGRDDDFLALGGDSLTATLVVSRLCEQFPLELGLKTFFEAPTVRGLAATIEAALVAERT
jgi:acyl transferase domain-containing protein